jgi:nucleotide-binding universal stress UspA family protein
MKILVCSDGRPPAERAIRFIRGAAAACKAEVTLLGIIEYPSDEVALGEALRRGADLLREKGVAVEIVTRAGHPITEIQRRTQEERYDFVLIGAERKGGGPFALSAKAYHIIKEIDPPVMVLAGGSTDLRKVLVCSSGYMALDKAVDLTAEMATKGRLEVTILHIMAAPPAIYSHLGDDAEEDADSVLGSNSLLARNLRKEIGAMGVRGVAARVRLRHGFVATEILREIETGEYAEPGRPAHLRDGGRHFRGGQLRALRGAGGARGSAELAKGALGSPAQPFHQVKFRSRNEAPSSFIPCLLRPPPWMAGAGGRAI